MSSKSDSATLKHNGRSTSQVSIYDYPEHLNPFYEAENHKRIRFWKIGKNKNNNNGGLGRRGSFSINGLKEMWAFKSFRPKKKSSTTSINKTSESPPPLRRDLQNNVEKYGTYNPQMRHTMQNDNFQRNVPYRTSLQDVRSSTTTPEYQNGFSNGFGRNQQYRSTIQTPNRMKRYDNSISSASTPQNLTPLHRRYVYGGSVTPQPTIRNINKGYIYNFDHSSTNFSRGSSQLSVATNPFEDDDDDIVIGHSIHSASSTNSLNQRPARKKRRAPQPPSANTEVSKAIEEESTSQKIQNNENNDILNLTAEIETFVKNSENDIIIETNNNNNELIITEKPNNSNDKIDNNENTTNKQTIIIQNIEKNENYPKATPRTSKKTEKLITNVDASPKIVITKTITYTNHNNDEEKISHKDLQTKNIIVTEKIKDISVEDNANVNVKQINEHSIEEHKLDLISDKENADSNQYSQTNGHESYDEVKTILVNNEIKYNEDDYQKNEKKIENTETKQINTVASPTTEKITETLTTSTVELKITESEEDISNIPTIENETEFGKYQIRYVPLKDNSPKVQRRNSRTNSPPPENYDLPPVPMTRRRSVREIIESINRSQSLLKPHTQNLNYNNNNEIEENNLNKISEKVFYENSEVIQINTKELSKESSPLSIDQNDNVVFEKCTTFKINNSNSRESSPTTSNLDWNPVPKPKRTKKLTADLMISEDAKSYNNNILI